MKKKTKTWGGGGGYTPTAHDLEIIDRQCADRMQMGMKKYGVFNPKTNARNLREDMHQEATDWRNYIDMRMMEINGDVSMVKEMNSLARHRSTITQLIFELNNKL